MSKVLDAETVRARQAARLESARGAFLKEFCTSGESEKGYELLRLERKILTLESQGVSYVPSFQFDETGLPRPTIAEVIAILGKDTSDWGVALWFTGANGWLDGQRPIDLLADNPKEVIQAAEHEAAGLFF